MKQITSQSKNKTATYGQLNLRNTMRTDSQALGNISRNNSNIKAIKTLMRPEQLTRAML